jgi:hypothetical protein
LLLALASAVFLAFESGGTCDHILLSQVWDSPNLEGQVPLFISPRHWVPFRRLLRLAGLQWWYSTPPPHGPVWLTEQSSSLLPATGHHGHSWHRASLGPMAIYLFNVKTFVFLFFRCCSFNKKGGLDFFYNWCSLTTPYSIRGHIKVGDIYILYIIHKTQTDTKFYYKQRHLSMQNSAAAYASTYLNLRNGS